MLHDRKKLLWRSFEKTGMLLRADKQCEDKICPEGLTGSYKFHEALKSTASTIWCDAIESMGRWGPAQNQSDLDSK